MAEYKLTSTNQELDDFLKREFKDRWNELLSEQLKKLKIDNINNAEDQIKRIFLSNILGLIDVSAQKKEIYNSELKKILGLKTNASKDSFKSEQNKDVKLLDKSLDDIKKEMFSVVRKEIDGGYYKVESIFNLFWLKAIEAELKGIKHEKVMSVVKDALDMVRNDVNLVFIKFEDEAELNKEFFKLLNTINKYVSINPPTNERYEKKKEVASIIFNTKKKFNNQYDGFINFFINTINEQIKFKKTGRSDFYLVNSDKKNALKTWDAIKNTYSNMSDSFKNIQN
jgi:hypothetical protein